MTESRTNPLSVGIIMDGNRRFAKERGLLALEGHRQGAETLKKVLSWAEEQSIGSVIAYAFSTENWKRDAEEVSGIMNLLAQYLASDTSEFTKRASIRFIGQFDLLPQATRDSMKQLEETSKGKDLTLAIAFSYGGRADITQAAQKLLQKGVTQITEQLLGAELLTAGIPDPDIILRTGGQQRLSNFLPWQSVYSELIFTDTLWPALTKEEFDGHINAFRERQRNFGV